jgi:sortase B
LPTKAPTPLPTITPTPSPEPTPSPIPTPTPEPTPSPTPTPKPKKKMPKLLSNSKGKRDEEGRLLQFKDLLDANKHVKGWIKDSTMDYVVLQSAKNNPEYYLFKDFFGDYYKAGSLFLDYRSSVERPSQNFVIHGHNMISTPEKMFHYIKFYKDVSYYKKHPIISFDTIYEEADYKVFAIIKTTPKANKDYFFEYRQSSFKDSSDFLNFVYQVRIRSLITVGDVDINEKDSLLTLSTCSYEVDNDYRTVVFARKVREGESSKVNMKTVKVNKKPLYCDDYYKQNGGKAPKLPATFEKALEKGDINWYTPLE